MAVNAFGRTIITDACVGIAMIITLVLINQLGQPYLRGFFCDDTSIAYPYKDNTVSAATVFAVGSIVPIGAMLIVELGLHKWLSHDKFDSRGWPKKAPIYSITVYHLVITFLFGAGATTVITEFGKVAIGRLRPHFLSVCQPVGPGYSLCQPNGAAQLRYVAAESYICNGSAAGFTSRQLKDARLSFPSGHSSYAVYTMLFLILYLQGRVIWRELRLLRAGLQTVAATLAYLCCLSRVTDNKHHPTDVLAGAILGALAACYVVFGTLRLMPVVSIRDVRRTLGALGAERDVEAARTRSSNEPDAELAGVSPVAIGEFAQDRSALPSSSASASAYSSSRAAPGNVNESAKVNSSVAFAGRPLRNVTTVAHNPTFSVN